MLSQKEEDSDMACTRTKLAMSTVINVYVNPHESVNDERKQGKEKEAAKGTEAQAKRSLFKSLKNKNYSC